MTPKVIVLANLHFVSIKKGSFKGYKNTGNWGSEQDSFQKKSTST